MALCWFSSATVDTRGVLDHRVTDIYYGGGGGGGGGSGGVIGTVVGGGSSGPGMSVMQRLTTESTQMNSTKRR